MARYGMVIDTTKCVGCQDCVIACQTENNVPEGFSKDWITTVAKGKFPNIQMEIRSERCNHCTDSPCVSSCPTGASHYHDVGGVVLVNHEECIGCKACIASCPYDARFVHPEGYVDKCTFCLHRVQKGQKPACVEVCPTKCLYFGDLEDPNSDVSLAIKDRKWKVLAPEAGTKPQLFFLT